MKKAKPNPNYPLKSHEQETIDSRTNCCEGCTWHPEVCEYCDTNKIVTDGDDEKTKERMDAGFSVFNLHVNAAGERADKEFIEQFGQQKFDKEIAPLHKNGVMSVFDKEPTIFTMAWVTLVTAYANEEEMVNA